MVDTAPPTPLAERLQELLRRGRELEKEGLPFPTRQLEETAASLSSAEQEAELLQVVKRGETLYAIASRDWIWIKQSLARADELGELAVSIGLDLSVLETRAGNPRSQLQKAPLSQTSLSRAAASASLALAVLNDAIPKFCVAEAQRLGESIRAARNRGEEVDPAVTGFSRLLAAIQDQHTVAMARALVEVRRAVARIPRAPSVPPIPSQEEEEILLEARNLARRLQQIKTRARNAQSAARLMTQVRAALSEERRFGTPEEEIEALWNEVDRLTRERQALAPAEAADGAATAGETTGPSAASEEALGEVPLDDVAEVPTSARSRTRARLEPRP